MYLYINYLRAGSSILLLIMDRLLAACCCTILLNRVIGFPKERNSLVMLSKSHLIGGTDSFFHFLRVSVAVTMLATRESVLAVLWMTATVASPASSWPV